MNTRDLPPTRFDPLGALIYYLCVRQAIERGDYRVPSSHKIAAQLALKRDQGGNRVPRSPSVLRLWDVLSWMNDKKLLFDARRLDKSQFIRELSQRNVNDRIKKFRPGFEMVSTRQRRIVPSEFVDQTATAIRLVALKDLYYFTHRRLEQKVLLQFLQQENLITGPDDYYVFLKTVKNIGYVEFDPPVSQVVDEFFWLEPGQVFRHQDMYVELRALDFFSERSRRDGRDERLQLRVKAAKFVQLG
jgi:hypothetical protein